MKDTKQKLYNHSCNVINGNLCKECVNNKLCRDKGCPVYKWRVK
jgi:hypothetical protein